MIYFYLLIALLLGFFWGFDNGFNYAKDIATGKRIVKSSKNFMLNKFKEKGEGKGGSNE